MLCVTGELLEVIRLLWPRLKERAQDLMKGAVASPSSQSVTAHLEQLIKAQRSECSPFENISLALKNAFFLLPSNLIGTEVHIFKHVKKFLLKLFSTTVLSVFFFEGEINS
jgi:hypothetical protein